MPPKRQRTVQGSCWACKQRRVKCDLAKPKCRRCTVSGAKCSYDKIQIRWNARPTKGAPIMYQSPEVSLTHARDSPLAVSELSALEYFQIALWPLLSTVSRPCAPPIALAMESQPVLLTMCELAEAHRRLRDECWARRESLECNSRRLNCLASVREQLRRGDSNTASLSQLLVAVLLLYFLDGFFECASQSASTPSHQAGVRAIIDHLGGFSSLIDLGHTGTNMLLSEFASADLTRSLLDDRAPCLPDEVWLKIEQGTVWWEKETYNGTTLASVFRTMAQMSFYRQSIVKGDSCEPSIEMCRHFERSLQPSYLLLSLDQVISPDSYTMHEQTLDHNLQAVSFTRAFQHSALIYLYRAICGLPPRHCLVQQHVQSCAESIQSINVNSRSHNCIIFPLYVMGAHAFTSGHQTLILERLGAIYQSIHFGSVLSVRTALQDMWESPRHDDWQHMFASLGQTVLVL